MNERATSLETPSEMFGDQHEDVRRNFPTAIPGSGELTTREAADVLNVSHEFVIGMIDRDEIPSRTMGGQRVLLLADLLVVKQKAAVASEEALRFLADQAQELDLGY